MSQTDVSKVVSPMKGDIILTVKGHRRLWDGRHWRILCRIPHCTAQRQGSLCSKLGLCKKHFNQIEFYKIQFNRLSSLPSNIEQEHKRKHDENKTIKRRNLNIIIDELHHSKSNS